MARKIIDIKNNRFGRLLVIREQMRLPNQSVIWNCICDCGSTVLVRGIHLRDGSTKSCGCFFTESVRINNTTHGLSKTRFYNIWKKIIARCYNSKTKGFKDYGGRGIKCLWSNFEEFNKDMYKSYLSHVSRYGEKQTSIDRINNDGNYCKENCRWATILEQNNNKRKQVKTNICICPVCKNHHQNINNKVMET